MIFVYFGELGEQRLQELGFDVLVEIQQASLFIIYFVTRAQCSGLNQFVARFVSETPAIKSCESIKTTQSVKLQYLM